MKDYHHLMSDIRGLLGIMCTLYKFSANYLFHAVTELVHVSQVEHGLGVVLLLRRDPEQKRQM